MKSNFEFLNQSFPVLSNLGGDSWKLSLFRYEFLLNKVRIIWGNHCQFNAPLDGIEPPDYDNTHAMSNIISNRINKETYYVKRPTRNDH